MKVRYKNKTYIFQWPKSFDDIIINAALKYIFPNSNFINWRKAEAEGALKGLPKILSLRDLSHRHTFLKYHNTKKFKERRRKANEKYFENAGKQNRYYLDKVKLFKMLPADLKKQQGWKPRKIWTEKQKRILIRLTEKYCRSEIRRDQVSWFTLNRIDWKRLVADPRIKQLPYCDASKLMKYYGQILNRKLTKKQIRIRRKEALDYKYKNYKKYRSSQKKNFKIIKNSVNKFLLSQLILR